MLTVVPVDPYIIANMFHLNLFQIYYIQSFLHLFWSFCLIIFSVIFFSSFLICINSFLLLFAYFQQFCFLLTMKWFIINFGFTQITSAIFPSSVLLKYLERCTDIWQQLIANPYAKIYFIVFI